MKKITSNDTTKTEILNSFFSIMFVKEENSNFILLDNISIVKSMENLIINDVDVSKRLEKLILINILDQMEFILES